MTTLVELAQEVLPQMEIISSVASAAIGIENRGENGLGFDANRSAFVSGNRVPIQIMRNARQAVHEDCLVLCNEPTIARVVSVCNNKTQTYYICRVAPPAALELENNMEVVSRDAPVGRLASLPPGKHTIEIERRGGRFENREHVILERSLLNPELGKDGWDSVQTVHESHDSPQGSPNRIPSLRAWLPKMVEESIFDIIEDEEEETDQSRTLQGWQRTVIFDMKLKDQPTLDQYQDEIFRLPIDSRLLLLGPPGTGKTTTLIRRLGQKRQEQYLYEDEKAIVGEIASKSQLPHDQSWLMFTPTELLKQYLKEAFAREKIPASDYQVYTWHYYRQWIARDVFKILSNPTNKNGLMLGETACLAGTAIDNPIGWFNDFDSWLRDTFIKEIKEEAKKIKDSDNFKDVKIQNKSYLDKIKEEIADKRYTTKDYKPEMDKLHRNKSRLDDRQKAIYSLEKILDEIANGTLGIVTIHERCLEIDTWISEIKKIKQLSQVSGMRILDNSIRDFIQGIPRRYRLYREQRCAENRWYGGNDRAIHPLELDVVLLSILKILSELTIRTWNLHDDHKRGLTPYQQVFHNQVFVDEATDFSPIQLGCMKALSNPKISSFFVCGDFNQRMTYWGTRDLDTMTWVCPDFETRSIQVDYRQSGKLNNFASRIAGNETHPNLPDNFEHLGVAPVLLEHAHNHGIISWLVERICEIDTDTGLPSIAVFVNSESEVEETVRSLEPSLQEHSIPVVACYRGQSVGTDRGVRVFDIQHIKGLEFEAVFFIGLDELAQQQQELFQKYLYVGATRAATYLGITCKGALPPSLDHLRDCFGDNWK